MENSVIDWPTMIVALVRAKEEVARVDKHGIFARTLPHAAASANQLDAFERHTSLTLDPTHRSFLGFADGWPAFFETQDLLGTQQLAGGKHREYFSEWIDSAPPEARAQGFSSSTLLPIAVDLEYPHFAAMHVVEGSVWHKVLIFAPQGLVETHETFERYFHSIIAKTRASG